MPLAGVRRAAGQCWPPRRSDPGRRDPSSFGLRVCPSCFSDSGTESLLSNLSPRRPHDSHLRLEGSSVAFHPRSCSPSPPCPSTSTWPSSTSSPPLSICCPTFYSGLASSAPRCWSPGAQTAHDAEPAVSLSPASRRSQMVARTQTIGWRLFPSCCSADQAPFPHPPSPLLMMSSSRPTSARTAPSSISTPSDVQDLASSAASSQSFESAPC